MVSQTHFVTREAEHRQHEAFAQLPSVRERLLLSIQGDPDKRVLGIADRLDRYAGWLTSGCLVVRFEDLVGPGGEGDADAQHEAVGGIYRYLGLDDDDALVRSVCGRLFSSDSPTSPPRFDRRLARRVRRRARGDLRARRDGPLGARTAMALPRAPRRRRRATDHDRIVPPRRRALRDRGVSRASLRSRKWTVIRILVAVLVATAVFTYLQHPVYQATAEVLLTSTSSSAGSGANNTVGNLNTEKAIIASPAIAGPVKKQLGLTTAETSIENHVKVVIPSGATILNIVYTARSASDAATIANTFADVYVGFKSDQAQAALGAATASLKTQLTKIEAQLQTISKALPQATSQGATVARSTSA